MGIELDYEYDCPTTTLATLDELDALQTSHNYDIVVILYRRISYRKDKDWVVL